MIYIVVEMCKYQGLQMLSPEKGWKGPRVFYATREAAEAVVALMMKRHAQKHEDSRYVDELIDTSYCVLEVSPA